MLPSAQPFRHPLEEYCLCLLLQHPELREKGMQLLPEYFEGTENRELFLAWHSRPDMGMLHHSLDVNLHHHLDSLMNRALPPASVKELDTALVDCRRRLEEQRLRRLKVLEEVLISEAESQGDQEEVQALLQKALAPSAQLRDLFLAGKRGRKGAQQ